MPTKLPPGLQVGRSDLFKLNPMELIQDDAANARWMPVSDDKVRELAFSIIEHGQLEPITVRKSYGKGESAKYQVVLGNTRAKAVYLINSDPDLRRLAAEKYGLEEGDVFPINCAISNVNEEDSFIRSIVENTHRNSTSPIDDAHNHERLREMGKTDTEISQLLQVHKSTISQIKHLLTLSDRHKMLVHNGEISRDIGLRLASLPPEDRDALLNENQGNPASLKSAVKSQQRRQGQAVGRSVKELKEVLTNATGDDVGYASAQTKEALLHILGWIKGNVSDDAFISYFELADSKSTLNHKG